MPRDIATPIETPTARPIAARGGGAKRPSLSRELGDFLIELSIALNRTVMYPDGHPSLDAAASAVVDHLAVLLRERSSLSIGIARQQLVIDGVATSSTNPVLRSLAERLHDHHIGAVTFRRNISPEEVLGTLKLLASEQTPDDRPLGLGNPARLAIGPHVKLYPVFYDRLEMVDEAGEVDREEDDSHRNSRLASLWIGMARAALAAEAEALEPELVEPTAVARAINEHPAAQAYDQVIVGYLLQIAGELRIDGGASTAAIRKHLARLIEGLNDDALDRLLAMGGDLAQRRSFMLDAVDGMTADTVVVLARAACRVSGHSLSEPLLHVLTKLAGVAQTGSRRASTAADSALRAHIRECVAEWTREDGNAGHGAATDPSGRTPAAQSDADVAIDTPEAVRLLHIALELDAYGPPVMRALDALVSAGASKTALEVLAEARECETVRAAWRCLGRRENVARLLADAPTDGSLLDRVLAATDPGELAGAVIDAVAGGSVRPDHPNARAAASRCRSAIVDGAGQRLGDEKGPRRALLALLNELAAVPAGVSPLALASDPDPLVRREAIRLALLSPAESAAAIGRAVADEDERVVRLGLRAVETGVPDAAVVPLAERAGDSGLPVELRTAIVRALSTVQASPARDALLRVTVSGRTLFGRPRLAPRSPEMLAGLVGLSARWAAHPTVARVLKRARRSSDPQTRAAAQAGP